MTGSADLLSDLPPLPLTTSSETLLDDGGDRRFRQMIYDLLHLEVQMREARDRLAAAIGVSGPGYAIMMIVGQHGEGIRVGDVADRLHVTGAFVTVETGRLMRLGMIEKRTDPADRRAVLLHLAPEGRHRINSIAGRIRLVNDYFFGDLTRGEFEALSGATRKLGSKSIAALLDAFPVEV